MKSAGMSVAPALFIGLAVVAIPLVLKLNRAPSVSPPRVTPGTCAEQAAPNDPRCAGPRAGTGAAVAAQHAVPRFVDLGTTTCAPCRVMLGVMDELRRDYPGAMGMTFGSAATRPLWGMTLLLAFGLGHCGFIGAAGSSTEFVQRYLDWNETSRAATVLKYICGVAVLLAAGVLIYTA